MGGHTYIQELLDRLALCEKRIAMLKEQRAELLSWAKLGASAGRTDSNWDAADKFLRDVAAGEFGEVK